VSVSRILLASVAALLVAGAGFAIMPATSAPQPEAAAAPAKVEKPTAAAIAAAGRGPVTDLPLPRFVSLKSAKVNVRIGPGKDYPVSWLYMKPGLPVEIIGEYDLWRRIRDSEGTEGWVYHSLLSGSRTSIAAPWLKGKATTIDVYRTPAADAPVVAMMEPGVVSSVAECHAGWCNVEVASRAGFVKQAELWGVYPDEAF
jgi:SH3-like domain-containing protein